jgi:hypothetical protein
MVYITQINAVHGGMRDIGNDAASGAMTTPVLLGCGVDNDGVPLVSRPMIVFAAATEIAQVGVLVGIASTVPKETSTWWLVPAIALGVRIAATGLGWRAFQRREDFALMMSLGGWHLFWALTAAVAAALTGAPWWLAGLILTVFFVPAGVFARLTT